MIIRKANINVIHVHDDDCFWTVVESYRKYDTINPSYTIILEDAHASPIQVFTNQNADEVNEYFGHDVIGLLND